MPLDCAPQRYFSPVGPLVAMQVSLGIQVSLGGPLPMPRATIEPDPLGTWLALNGERIAASELPELAGVCSHFVTDGWIEMPNAQHPFGHLLVVKARTGGKGWDAQQPVGVVLAGALAPRSSLDVN